MHKKTSIKRKRSNSSSCDVSASICEDSMILEETGIAQKIKSVNVHNNQIQKSI